MLTRRYAALHSAPAPQPAKDVLADLFGGLGGDAGVVGTAAVLPEHDGSDAHGQEILERLHLIRGQLAIIAEQTFERRVEGFDAGAIARTPAVVGMSTP